LTAKADVSGPSDILTPVRAMAWLTVGVMAAAASAAPPDEQARAREIHAHMIGVDAR
jgi:hypothetical protein